MAFGESATIKYLFLYEKALKSAPAAATIQVEKIHGPILLFSAQNDATWPSTSSCERIQKRLALNHFNYPVKHVSYRHASHVLIPIDNPKVRAKLRIYKVERKYPKACQRDRKKAFLQTLTWLKHWGPEPKP